jgi:hypothetical protein
VIFTLLLTSCSDNSSNEYLENKEVSDEFMVISEDEFNEETNRVYNILDQCIRSRDTESIKNEFSDYAKDRADLDFELDKIFDFIDGNIVSVESASAGYGGGSSKEKYGVTRSNYNIQFFGIHTDTDKVYDIYCYGIFYYKDNDDKCGINLISVVDNELLYKKTNSDFNVDENDYKVMAGVKI